MVFAAFEAPIVKAAAALNAQRPKAKAKGKPKVKPKAEPKAAEPAAKRPRAS